MSTPQDVENALLGTTSGAAEEAITANNGVAAAVRTRAEWIATPIYAAASSGPWIRISRPPPSASESPQLSRCVPSAVPRHPLAGLKVLDLTGVIAGPTATRLLGALGADVLRSDPPQLPDLSDVFGLTPEALLLARPDLVIVTLSAWGSGGPWNGWRGFDSLVQAACGIAEWYGRTTDDGWQPGALPVQALDRATGYGLAAAAIALLAERLRSGPGRRCPAFPGPHS